MARKNGCPMTVRDWAIDILSRASTKANPTWIRIKGLTSMTLSTDADTEDGSSAESLWGEPYVTKRNGSLSLEGRPVIDSVTGAQDPGQAELDYSLMARTMTAVRTNRSARSATASCATATMART